MTKCLYCYKEILNAEELQQEFHKKCSKLIFDTPAPPLLEYDQNEILALAKKIIQRQSIVTGVQTKISLGRKKISKHSATERFTIIGEDYILKPQTKEYPQLPEIEHLTMRLALLSKIKTVKHSLIRLKSGELAYITKRIDRLKDRKLHLEDMCQLTERLTEHKYKGSHQQIAKKIRDFSSTPGLDIINFYELVLFSFLTGNNDMHLKNFSLLKDTNFKYQLCPAYDLVAASLLVEEDKEELALNLNSKKRKLKKKDFEIAMKNSKVNEKQIENIFKKMKKYQSQWHEIITISFLDEKFKQKYHKMIDMKFKQLEM